MNHHHTQHRTDYTTGLHQADLAAALAIDHTAVTEVLNAESTDPAVAAGARVQLWWQLTRWLGPRMPLPLMLTVEITHGMPWQAAAALEVLSEVLRTAEALTQHHTQRQHEQKGPQDERR